MTDESTLTDADERNEGPLEKKISPEKGKRVRHEGGKLLEPKTIVTWSAYWQRRADDGDILVHEPKAKTEKKD